jgi:hypothetical protein
MAEKTPVAISEVRAWLRSRGHAVGSRGHIPEKLIAEFNHRHHRKVYRSSNPWSKKESGDNPS